MKPLPDWGNPFQQATAFQALHVCCLACRRHCRNPMGMMLLLLLTAFLPLYAQPAIQWDKTLGGSGGDGLQSLQQTRDGGYILGGTSASNISGDKTEASKGSEDYWVVKLDAAGNKQWDKTIGGNAEDYFRSLQQTSDGGYILGGLSFSPVSGDKTEATQHFPDYWVVKLDSAGNKQWDKTIGGGGDDRFTILQQTLDGGYILGGYSTSDISGDKTEASKGGFDYWAVKLDAAGNKVWDKTLGSNADDYLTGLQQTGDGGYILGGYSSSGISGDKTEANRGECSDSRDIICSADYWLVKLDAAGSKQWDKTIGGTGGDFLTAVQQTGDGGYILGGESTSPSGGDKTEANKRGCPTFNCTVDFWVVKLDAAGNKVWDNTLGGLENDDLHFLQQTLDGGYLLGGSSSSGISEDKTQASKGEGDYWVVQLDTAGNKIWDITIGGIEGDNLTAIQQTKNGGYILGGGSDSGIGGDKTEASRGRSDYWVVQLAPFQQAQLVASLALINAETGQPIQLLREVNEINLAALRTDKLTIGADTNPDTVGSVLFELSGQQNSRHLDNQVPYALFGDTIGQYNVWRPEPGRYTLTATPYSQPDGQGQAGTPLTIHFTLFSEQVSPRIAWDKTLGGSGDDWLTSLQQTLDGGFILGGYSHSDIGSDKTDASRGDIDYWVLKLDAAGIKRWDKTYGGDGEDYLTALQQTKDGGYILGGYSASGISSDKTDASRGERDYWVVKLDAAGNKQWDKTFGGNEGDALESLQQTLDGGYILGGSSWSGLSGDKTEASKGGTDYWIVKLDTAGNKVWDKTIGGWGFDGLASLQQTLDGGYILGGSSDSDISADKTEAFKGRDDYWVVKLDAAGNKQWDKTYGGSEQDYLESLQQTNDGGYILGGSSYSGMGLDKTDASRGGSDYWVVKLDSAGHKQWDKTIGGSTFDSFKSLQKARAGYILGGYSDSYSSGDKTQASRGGTDYWIVKLDADGNQQWDKTLGGNRADALNALQQTQDGGYVLGGSSDSPISFDKTEASRGDRDYWVVKLAPFPETRQVKSFTLINAQNDQPIRTLNNGDTLHLADLPTRKLNIRADTDPDAVGSVRFTLRGKLKITRLDNERPYALLGDVSGEYNEWTPAPGRYRVSATPYARPNARGKAGTPLTIHFTVVRRPAAVVATRMEQAPEAARAELAPTPVIYPNPTADGLLQVRLTGQVPGPLRYSLLSVVGRKLAEGTMSLTDAGNQFQFDFSRQLRAPGLYYLRIQGAHMQQTFKIMRK